MIRRAVRVGSSRPLIVVALSVLAACSSSSSPKDGLSGNLGALGPLEPTVSSLYITNSGEVLVYLSSAPITCDQLTVSRWLGQATKGSHVVELVFRGPPAVGTISIPPGEVNYAAGGRSSASEVVADSGSITIAKVDPPGTIEGNVTSSHPNGAGVSGTFRATFCAGGQGY